MEKGIAEGFLRKTTWVSTFRIDQRHKKVRVFKPRGRFVLGAFHKLRLHLGWVGGQKNV